MAKKSGGLWGALAVAALLVLFPDRVSAYRTLADEPNLVEEADGQAIGWTHWPLTFEVFEQEGDLVDGVGTQQALAGGIAVWQASMCASDALAVGGMTTMPGRLDDGRNTIQWVHSGWSRYGGADAVAITQTLYKNNAGHYTVVDADIYLNGERAWDASMLALLDGVLAHELGHAIGLLHPCERNGEGGAPRCGNEPVTLMHPRYDPNGLMLTADDEAGACFLYPGDKPRDEVEIEKACAVSIVHASSSTPTAPVFSALAACGALLVRRRRCVHA